MTRPTSFHFEQLEDRTVPATIGTPWPEPGQLTLSFAPDQVQIGHLENELFETLGQQFNTEEWQIEILRAFQTWAVHMNANIGLVSDSGAAFGAIGLSQGDPRFGDIRIAAFDQPDDIIANNVPFQPVAGSWSGDVFLNTAIGARLGGDSGIDLFTVMLNEAGNVFGLIDNNDLTSAMYTNYAGMRNGLSFQDIVNLQALYGERTPDDYEGYRGNGSFSTATYVDMPLLQLNSAPVLRSVLSLLGSWSSSDPVQLDTEPVVLDADITTNRDVDIYKFKAPLNSDELTIRLETNGISLLTGRLSVYNSWGRLIHTVRADGPLDGDLAIQLRTIGGMKYYVKVEGAVDDVFGIGAYQLQIDFDPLAEELLDTTSQLVNDIGLIDQLFTDVGLINQERRDNNTFATATLLETPPGYNPHTRYEAVESLSSAGDVDMYRFRTPDMQAPVMLVTVGSLGSNELDFEIQVFDQDLRRVDATIHTNPDGSVSIELAGAEANTDYYLKVTGADGSEAAGNYFVVIDFGSGAAELESQAAGTLSQSNADDFSKFVVEKSQLFRFDLSAETATAAATSAVRMTIYDDAGNVVFTMAVRAGQVRTRYVWLDAGSYVVRFSRLATGDRPASQIHYELLSAGLSDDVGPMQEDTTEEPVEDPAYEDPTYDEFEADWYTWEDASEQEQATWSDEWDEPESQPWDEEDDWA